MRAFVITHSSTYETRAEAAGAWLKEQGCEVTWIFSDFDHRELKNVKRQKTDHVFLHMVPYSGNLSPNRIRSIRKFAVEVEKYLTGQKADLLYFMIPANSFVQAAARMKKRTGAKVIFDIIDLWPESLPLAHVEKLLPVYAWKQLRDRYIGCADVIFTECGLYRELIRLPKEKTHTLYWFREETGSGCEADGSVMTGQGQESGCTGMTGQGQESGCSGMNDAAGDGCLHIAYLGAINNIIDIEGISKLLQLLQKERPVVVEVIGYGKRKDNFLRALDEIGVQSEDYGAVFDEQEKAEIFRRCSFGLNMMVPQVRVGLTMKSLDYLAAGLPLLNNIKGDTQELIEEYDAGINIPREDMETVIPEILAMADDPLAGSDARRLFEEKLSGKQFRSILEEALTPLLREGGLIRDGAAVDRSQEKGMPREGAAVDHSQEKGLSRESAAVDHSPDDGLPRDGVAADYGPESGLPHDRYCRDTGMYENGKEPVISVVMAACNGETYLPEQMESILPQLGENDEVVVSVDPSQDRTFEILFEYAAKDPRIRVLEGPGKGVIRNVENALRNCSGQMIFLADQDDVWMPDKVEKVSRALTHNMLVLHDAEIVDAELKEIAPSFMNWRKSRKGVLANIRKNSYIGCCMAFGKELLPYILPFPENLPMHDQWIGLMAEKHGSVRLLHVPLIRYRRHGDNATKQTHASPAQMLVWRAEITREVIKR